jgi:hypothetical protein
MARIYSRGEKPHDVFGLNAGPNKLSTFHYLKIGRIVEIDYEKYKFKVNWVTGTGSPDWIPISFPYVGPGSCMGSMPEIGSLVLCGYINAGISGKGSPYALSYIPVSLQTALEHNSVKKYPDQISSEEDNLLFYKFRKLQKGDVIMSSLWGGEIFVNRDVQLKDGFRDSILMRSSDQSIIMTSLNSFVFNNGVSLSSGSVIRNKISIFDAEGNRIPNQLAREISLPDGRDNIHLVPFGERVEENSMFYTEYRIDVEDISPGVLETNDINSQTILSDKDPIVSFVLGNYVGSVDTNNRYGKILHPVLFSSSIDYDGQFNMTECVQNKGVDEVEKIGLAYAVHLLKNDSFMGFDKEGHFYLNMNASTSANPMGAGRSMSILGTGNLKEVWGQSADDGNSWDYATKGGIKWNIGQHNVRSKNRSIDIRTSSGIKIEVRNNDDEGYAKQELLYGNQRISVGGNESLEVYGNSDSTYTGSIHEQILGAASYDYHTNKTETCTEVYTQTVVKEMQGNFGLKKEKILKGQELTIAVGNKTETLLKGSKKTTLIAGNIEETIVAGNRKVNIVAGKYTVSVKAGNIEIGTLTGQAKVNGNLGVVLQSLVKADIKALKVKLGSLPIKGGVVVGLGGIPSHFDYVTGIPLKGSSTVSASI